MTHKHYHTTIVLYTTIYKEILTTWEQHVYMYFHRYFNNKYIINHTQHTHTHIHKHRTNTIYKLCIGILERREKKIKKEEGGKEVLPSIKCVLRCRKQYDTQTFFIFITKYYFVINSLNFVCGPWVRAIEYFTLWSPVEILANVFVSNAS